MRNGQDIAVSTAQVIHDLLEDVKAANARVCRVEDNIAVRYGALSVIVDDITIRRLTALYQTIFLRVGLSYTGQADFATIQRG